MVGVPDIAQGHLPYDGAEVHAGTDKEDQGIEGEEDGHLDHSDQSWVAGSSDRAAVHVAACNMDTLAASSAGDKLEMADLVLASGAYCNVDPKDTVAFHAEKEASEMVVALDTH